MGLIKSNFDKSNRIKAISIEIFDGELYITDFKNIR